MEQRSSVRVDQLSAEGKVASIQIDSQAGGVQRPPAGAREYGLVSEDSPQCQVWLRRQRGRAKEGSAHLTLPGERVEMRRVSSLQRGLALQIGERAVGGATDQNQHVIQL